MILVDTSVWVDHLRAGDSELAAQLESGAVLAHPWVIGEIALGNLRRRDDVLGLLHGLPQAGVATDDEVLVLIGRETLYDAGLGYVEAQLLAAARLTSDAVLWTRDNRLSRVAGRLGLAFQPQGRPDRYQRSGHATRVQDSSSRMVDKWGDVLDRLGKV